MRLPDPLSSNALQKIMASLPSEILRVKGCTRLDEDTHYTFLRGHQMT